MGFNSGFKGLNSWNSCICVLALKVPDRWSFSLYLFYLQFWAGIAQSVWRLATGWMVLGSKPVVVRDSPHPSTPALGPVQPPIQWIPGSFPVVKRAGRVAYHSPPSSAEVKERVELYLYSPSGPSWPVLGWTLHLPLALRLPEILVHIMNVAPQRGPRM